MRELFNLPFGLLNRGVAPIEHHLVFRIFMYPLTKLVVQFLQSCGCTKIIQTSAGFDLETVSMNQDGNELAELRQRVDCRVVLDRAGWELDARESSRLAAKYRQGAARIVIVTHEGKGWFDPLEDKRGDVIALAQHVWGGSLGYARKNLRPLAGIVPQLLPSHRDTERVRFDSQAAWAIATPFTPNSPAWEYLAGERRLPVPTIERAIEAGALRQGVYGTLWAAHQTAVGRISGWEMRGPQYKGFSKGGTKALFVLGQLPVVERLVVTESVIDAMSLATLEGWRSGTVYTSTGGGYGSETATALRELLSSSARLVAATDLGVGGDRLAVRLKVLATAVGNQCSRLIPKAKDWNEQLRDKTRRCTGSSI